MVEQSSIEAVTFGAVGIPLQHLDFFEMRSASGDVCEAMLAVFRSALGSQLQSRDLSAAEIDEMRKTVSRMVDLAAQTDAGLPQDFLIEFADGDELNFRMVPPSRRAVFGFDVESWRSEGPVRVQVD